MTSLLATTNAGLSAERLEVAYLSMEIALASDIPTYCGGLGVLAGDHLRAAADLGIRAVGLTLCYQFGYFRQRINEGHQVEEPVLWDASEHLTLLDESIELRLRGRPVILRAWRYDIVGRSGHTVPVLLLDSNDEPNAETDRLITDQIYGGDAEHRLLQEAVLGLGSIELLKRLGWWPIPTVHMNEGHAALAVIAANELSRSSVAGEELADSQFVFTTHTPIPEGHDRFSEKLVHATLGVKYAEAIRDLGGTSAGEFNTTRLALRASRFSNAVSRRHAQISRSMFPTSRIESLTNGVHGTTWVSSSISHLLDRHVPTWRRDNATLRYATEIPLDELEQAHNTEKDALFRLVFETTGIRLDPSALTLGIARRAASYKRTDLLLSDRDRLSRIVDRVGTVNIVYSGKAHPQDRLGKQLIQRIIDAATSLAGIVKIAYVPDYEMNVSRTIVAGSDVWINTPVRPLEASGTSGMKAALNAVPSLSILDGWWIEGCVEGVTGWSFGGTSSARNDVADAQDLYDKLEQVVAPLFYRDRPAFSAVGRAALALNGSFYTAERMVGQYAAEAYGLDANYGRQRG